MTDSDFSECLGEGTDTPQITIDQTAADTLTPKITAKQRSNLYNFSEA